MRLHSYDYTFHLPTATISLGGMYSLGEGYIYNFRWYFHWNSVLLESSNGRDHRFLRLNLVDPGAERRERET
jgi:hypothetical protein